ncbi:hypothetical protein BCR35DRAFT_14323 [Leucosporidium creatinivorum]|uniref:Uncharacterized protein n=1 Tax=Leucosporidium creatinivorum TaxID=106004 RepID=A0A1Y2FZ23_9BASI|nr:hypothetical protein BCR35DRAFT_14323 [Leucosporidium creatinivorum]
MADHTITSRSRSHPYSTTANEDGSRGNARGSSATSSDAAAAVGEQTVKGRGAVVTKTIGGVKGHARPGTGKLFCSNAQTYGVRMSRRGVVGDQPGATSRADRESVPQQSPRNHGTTTSFSNIPRPRTCTFPSPPLRHPLGHATLLPPHDMLPHPPLHPPRPPALV